MPRIVNEEEYNARRNQILDVAQRYIYTKGYEQMSIQDILNDLQISKGAFYHYFDSKSTLLEALLERIMEGVLQLVQPIVEDENMPCLEKINRFFSLVGTWKTTQKTFMLGLLTVWYTDNNALTRQKLQSMMIKKISPVFSQIIRQGILEGVLDTPFPDQIAEIILLIFQGLGEYLSELLVHPEQGDGALQRSERLIAAYTAALERLIGAPSNSLILMDANIIKVWFSPEGENQ